jgi:hypothetical protein
MPMVSKRSMVETRGRMLSIAFLCACGSSQPTPQPPAPVVQTAAAAPAPNPSAKALAATPSTPRDACDDPARERECVREVFGLLRATERDAALAKACSAGRDAACYFRKTPQTFEERLDYFRRACAFAVSRVCGRILDAMRAGRVDANAQYPAFGHRWVKQLTQLTTESDTSVELIAHPGARVLLLDVVDGAAFALVKSFDATDEYDRGDPLIAEHTVVNASTDEGIVVSLPAAALSE